MHAVVGLVVAVSLAGCSVSPDVTATEAEELGEPADADTAPESDLEWGPCDDLPTTGIDIECATVPVPLDHADPDDASIDLAIARVESRGDDVIGSLVFNPGGPGASGIEFLVAAATIMPSELSDRFDLVSFDPRGVGTSTAIECDIDRDDVVALAEGDDAGWEQLLDDATSRPERCTPASADLAPYVGTMSAARDLDLLREALGDDTLSYVGFSYGTRLGAAYAELFPDRVRALVLDGAVTPTSDLAELGSGQAPGFDRAFERFADSCDDDADCPLDGTGDARDVYRGLLDELGTDGSLATDDPDRRLTSGELQLGVAAALYSTQLWQPLGVALDEATRGDGTLLQALVDSYVGRRPDGSYDDSQSAGLAINCADDPNRPPAEDVRRIAEEVAAQSSWFDGFLRADTGCIGTADPVDPVVFGPATGAPPILVVGTTGDPATPYEWAEELSELLDAAVLYTVDGDGHTAFLSIECVEPVVVRYLVDLEVPEAGGTCAADDDVDPFPPAGTGEFDQVIAFFDCLRDNGADVPEIDLSDLLADPSGADLLEDLDPTGPAFGRAVLACQDLVPDL